MSVMLWGRGSARSAVDGVGATLLEIQSAIRGFFSDAASAQNMAQLGMGSM